MGFSEEDFDYAFADAKDYIFLKIVDDKKQGRAAAEVLVSEIPEAKKVQARKTILHITGEIGLDYCNEVTDELQKLLGDIDVTFCAGFAEKAPVIRTVFIF